eukprot:TRINITY_DN30494_c0_g1_i1.p1 TRINITY_DN30494_c0_g1~~TRINITY_DN30494_c0_g1_i1.p1  ORF type:complete len:521 (-),score=124.41 TRINITY_DN30494_c0_g1_i1:408-1970(-)
MAESFGLLSALAAAIAFGVQYVPVKKYEIFDGITFQWFMCAGILMVGFFVALFFGDFGMQDKDSRLIIFGGALWAASNYLVLPLVKLLGIGLGFSLYHFVNLVVGYLVGRFGFFGLNQLEGTIWVCDFGCALVLVSFVLMVFVEGGDDTAAAPARSRGGSGRTSPATSCSPQLSAAAAASVPELPLPAAGASEVESREMYHRWRQEPHDAHSGSLIENLGQIMINYSTAERGSHHHSIGGFSVLATPPKSSRSFRSSGTTAMASAVAIGGGVGAGHDAEESPQEKDSGAGAQKDMEAAASPCRPADGDSLPAAAVPAAASAAAAGAAPLLDVSGNGCSHAAPRRSRSGSASGITDVGVEMLAQHCGAKFVGVLLAVVAGGLAGVQSVPAALRNQRQPNASATSVVFPQCLGIYICSSCLYIVYASAAKMSGWPVPHSVIRPAYVSGCIWAAGFAFMIYGIRDLGFSVGYVLDAVGPIIVASLLSIVVFREITDPKRLALYAGAFTLQLGGVILMTFFGRH